VRTLRSEYLDRIVMLGYIDYYNTDRVHHGRLTCGRIPADIVYGVRKRRPDEPKLSAHLGDGPGSR
jgi:hypothetical protein